MDFNYSMDIHNISSLLINAINPDKSLSQKCSNFLEEEQKNKDFWPMIFFIIQQNHENANNLDLIATIYLRKYLEKSYKLE